MGRIWEFMRFPFGLRFANHANEFVCVCVSKELHSIENSETYFTHNQTILNQFEQVQQILSAIEFLQIDKHTCIHLNLLQFFEIGKRKMYGIIKTSTNY